MQLLAHIQFTVACHASVQPLVAASVDVAEQVSSGLRVSLRHFGAIAKLAQKHHSVAFHWAAAPFVDYLLNYLMEDGGAWVLGETARPEEFIIKCLVFVAGCVKENEYFAASPLLLQGAGVGSPAGAGAATGDGSSGPRFMDVMLPVERVKKLVSALVCRGLVLTKAELESWEDDAEEYEMDDVCAVVGLGLLACLLACLKHRLNYCSCCTFCVFHDATRCK
jgi:hypothetical protein